MKCLPPSLSPSFQSFQFSSPVFLPPSLFSPSFPSLHTWSVFAILQSPCWTPGTRQQMCLHFCPKFTTAWSRCSGTYEFHRLFFLTRDERLINTFIYLGNNQGWWAFIKPGFGTRNATFAQSHICLLFKPAKRIKLMSSVGCCVVIGARKH